jgi:YD repeat-containing protein
MRKLVSSLLVVRLLFAAFGPITFGFATSSRAEEGGPGIEQWTQDGGATQSITITGSTFGRGDSLRGAGMMTTIGSVGAIPVGVRGSAGTYSYGVITSSTGNSGATNTGAPAPTPTNANGPAEAQPTSEQNTTLPVCPGGGSSNPTSQNPVVLATGEKVKEEQDFAVAGLHGLTLRRTYRSKGSTGQLFGPNWTSSVDPPNLTPSTLTVATEVGPYPRDATIAFPGGERLKYRIDLSDYPYSYKVSGNAAAGTVSYDTSARVWKLNRYNKSWTFYASGGPASSGGGLTYTSLVQSGFYQITRITNSVGQQVNFTWTGNRVTQVTAPSGSVWTYAYNANGMLTSVSSPGPNSDVRSYHYEDPSDNKLLTGISINGVRYSTYAYYADKRVKESGLAGGEERDTFTYGANQNTLTDARGQPTTYTFASIANDLKLTGVSRSATASCVAASATTVYDANGYVDYKLDWNGNKTDYTYDSSGHITSLIKAAGTPNAMTTIYTWSGGLLSEESYRNTNGVAYAKTNFAYHLGAAAGLSAGRLSSVTFTDLRLGGTRQTSYAYTFHTNKSLASMAVTEALPGGQTAVSTTTYDTVGNVVSVTNPLGHQVLWTNTTAWDCREK